MFNSCITYLKRSVTFIHTVSQTLIIEFTYKKYCVLPGKYNTYGEKLTVYGYILMKRQQLERTNNVSSKKDNTIGVCKCFACKLETVYVLLHVKTFYIIPTFNVGLKQSEMIV